MVTVQKILPERLGNAMLNAITAGNTTSAARRIIYFYPARVLDGSRRSSERETETADQHRSGAPLARALPVFSDAAHPHPMTARWHAARSRALGRAVSEELDSRSIA